MKNEDMNIEIDKYLDKNWDKIVQDIASLVEIPSSVNDGIINEEYPTGIGPCKAMEQALKIAKRLGFKTQNHKNVIGIADLDGESDTQIGFIGHCDVVVPGTGWQFDPYKLNIINGFMVGRGVLDDKGPSVILLHAIKYWLQNNKKLPYSIRFLFGTDEETSSTDVQTFIKDFEEPRIVITPDADFPVQYGEKGLFRFKVNYNIKDGQIKSIFAGESANATAGKAIALIDMKAKDIDLKNSRLAHAVKITETEEGLTEITATGRATHAAYPYEGIDSTAIMSHFLIEQKIGTKEEQKFFEFISKIAGKPKGEGVGLNVGDEHFEDLTIVPTCLRMEDNAISQAFDVRYPMCINPEEIEKRVRKHAPKGSTFEAFKSYTPFIVNPKSRLIKALADAYEKGAEEEARLFTMGGATYARRFKCGTSFGPLRVWVKNPAWVGTLHGPNEGISEDEMKLSFKVYVHMLENLMKLDIDSDDFIKEATTLD